MSIENGNNGGEKAPGSTGELVDSDLEKGFFVDGGLQGYAELTERAEAGDLPIEKRKGFVGKAASEVSGAFSNFFGRTPKMHKLTGDHPVVDPNTDEDACEPIGDEDGEPDVSATGAQRVAKAKQDEPEKLSAGEEHTVPTDPSNEPELATPDKESMDGKLRRQHDTPAVPLPVVDTRSTENATPPLGSKVAEEEPPFKKLEKSNKGKWKEQLKARKSYWAALVLSALVAAGGFVAQKVAFDKLAEDGWSELDDSTDFNGSSISDFVDEMITEGVHDLAERTVDEGVVEGLQQTNTAIYNAELTTRILVRNALDEATDDVRSEGSSILIPFALDEVEIATNKAERVASWTFEERIVNANNELHSRFIDAINGALATSINSFYEYKDEARANGSTLAFETMMLSQVNADDLAELLEQDNIQFIFEDASAQIRQALEESNAEIDADSAADYLARRALMIARVQAEYDASMLQQEREEILRELFDQVVERILVIISDQEEFEVDGLYPPIDEQVDGLWPASAQLSPSIAEIINSAEQNIDDGIALGRVLSFPRSINEDHPFVTEIFSFWTSDDINDFQRGLFLRFYEDVPVERLPEFVLFISDAPNTEDDFTRDAIRVATEMYVSALNAHENVPVVVDQDPGVDISTTIQEELDDTVEESEQFEVREHREIRESYIEVETGETQEVIGPCQTDTDGDGVEDCWEDVIDNLIERHR